MLFLMTGKEEIFFNVFNSFIYFSERERERERETVSAGEGQRARDTDSEVGSRLRAASTEPDVGLELMD